MHLNLKKDYMHYSKTKDIKTILIVVPFEKIGKKNNESLYFSLRPTFKCLHFKDINRPIQVYYTVTIIFTVIVMCKRKEKLNKQKEHHNVVDDEIDQTNTEIQENIPLQ